jgi:hypothetical protein
MQLRQGLIRVDADGPDRGPVLRSPNHTFSLMTTIGIDNAFGSFPFAPPDQRLGWSGDGSPGRGTLNEFVFGAIVQHFPKNLQRRPGVDFRIPTQEEVDAIEAFQLFTGRQKLVSVTDLGLRDARAEDGRALFLGKGQCTGCHFDMTGRATNLDITNGSEKRTPQFAFDDGFKIDVPGGNDFDGMGDAFFNIPPLVEAADTAPLFHNNSAATIEDAVEHYTTTLFNPSGGIPLTQTEQLNIAAFLRVINAAENLRQVRKRVIYVRDNRSPGNTNILDVALADTQDALDVLGEKNLNPNVRQVLLTVKQTLQIAKANADADRPSFMAHALAYLDVAKSELFSKNPTNEF